jgi:hypothetical protein
MVPFWFTGPWTFKTRSGTRITFLACVVTIPLTAFSIHQLTRSPRGKVEETTQNSGRSSSVLNGDVDLPEH